MTCKGTTEPTLAKRAQGKSKRGGTERLMILSDTLSGVAMGTVVDEGSCTSKSMLTAGA